MMLKRIDHVGVIVDDLAEAEKFLGEGLGMRKDREISIPGRLNAAFFQCGEVMIEVIEIVDEGERERRLGSDKARMEHIAVEVDDLARAMEALRGLGVKGNTPEPVRIGANLNVWTDPETTDGYQFQFFQKGAP